jgi:hypothetical protein
MTHAWTIERKPLRVTVFDIPRIREAIFGEPIDRIVRSDWDLQAWASIVDGYFSLQNTVLFEQFQAEIVSAQSALLALGAPFFDPRPLQMLSGVMKTHRVAVFLNLGADRGGFVAPGGTGPLLINLGGINNRVPGLLKDLRESYGFEHFDDSPLHQSTRVFADFVARARRHEIDSRLSEALLTCPPRISPIGPPRFSTTVKTSRNNSPLFCPRNLGACIDVAKRSALR